MKKKTYLTLVLLLICAASLIVLGIFLARRAKRLDAAHGQVSSRADNITSLLQKAKRGEAVTEAEIMILTDGPDVQPALSAESASQAQSVTDQPAEGRPDEGFDEKVSESVQEALPEHQLIFVGDSRTVGMGKAEAHLHDRCVYVGESGEGCDWFIEYGIDQMDEAIRRHRHAPVIFNLGVNDCDHVDEYIEVYHEIEKGYPDTVFYYMSVNPVTKDSPHVPLSDILEFNQKLKAAFPDQYIDTCSWMISGGFEDVDGVHYSEEQYCAIHDFAVKAVTGN